MSRISSKQNNMTGAKPLPKSSMDFLEVDPEVFLSTVEKHQERILRPPLKPPPAPDSEELSRSKKAKNRNERPRRRRRRKQPSSFIKLRAGTIPMEKGPSITAKKLLALRLPNGIELEFWS